VPPPPPGRAPLRASLPRPRARPYSARRFGRRSRSSSSAPACPPLRASPPLGRAGQPPVPALSQPATPLSSPAARRWPPLPCISRRRSPACSGPVEPDKHVAPARGGNDRHAQSKAPTLPLHLRSTCCSHRSATPEHPRPLSRLHSSAVPIGPFLSKESTSRVRNRCRHACLPHWRRPHLSDCGVVHVLPRVLWASREHQVSTALFLSSPRPRACSCGTAPTGDGAAVQRGGGSSAEADPEVPSTTTAAAAADNLVFGTERRRGRPRLPARVVAAASRWVAALGVGGTGRRAWWVAAARLAGLAWVAALGDPDKGARIRRGWPGAGVGRWEVCIRQDGGGDFRGDFYFSIYIFWE
jgi:hypothetical protein